MKWPSFIMLCCLILSCNATKIAAPPSDSMSEDTPSPAFDAEWEAQPGFLHFWWDAEQGKIWLRIDRLDQEMLYVNSLAAGVGSNDIGLDRGQLGQERVVKFVRVGPKILLVQPNYDYRAESDNLEERKAVEEAFAQSVLWGFTVLEEKEGHPVVDATTFLMRDAHGVVQSLQRTRQGSYKSDASRSAIYLPRTKNFPKNTEFEATLTFRGQPKGGYIRQVVPSPEAVTVRQHHSFVELPGPGYTPRAFHPRSGYFEIDFQDYATPIDQPLVKRLITRHRLAKKDPTAALSEPVTPIIYYLDRGTPEPIRSALLDGARWWNQAFEAAGYRNAFQVEMLPKGADPMDVRYNVIQWVHRATRGWSYGGSVIDPRTGEIIKGHVSLGSLRVRQDFMIAQGLLAPYESGQGTPNTMQEMALARLRQLSAHEVGHTIGLAHNFAASTNNRASVMDYPHPYITIGTDGQLDFSQAYDDKIGEWDKWAIRYGYTQFAEDANEATELNKLLNEQTQSGLRFISDYDARTQGGAHPYAHLWDNGDNAVTELQRLLQVRRLALERFGEKNIPEGAPMAELEKVLVPLYLAHRYQVEAVSKLVGGVHYDYNVRGDKLPGPQVVEDLQQRAALQAMMLTLQPESLMLPKQIIDRIPPQPLGYGRGREHFNGRTGPTFDPLAAAESISQATLQLLLHPQRMNRVFEHQMLGKSTVSVQEIIDNVLANGWKTTDVNYEAQLQRLVNLLALEQLFRLSVDTNTHRSVRSIAGQAIDDFAKQLPASTNSAEQRAHLSEIKRMIAQFREHPETWKGQKAPELPAGSPIGCGH